MGEDKHSSNTELTIEVLKAERSRLMSIEGLRDSDIARRIAEKYQTGFIQVRNRIFQERRRSGWQKNPHNRGGSPPKTIERQARLTEINTYLDERLKLFKEAEYNGSVSKILITIKGYGNTDTYTDEELELGLYRLRKNYPTVILSGTEQIKRVRGYCEEMATIFPKGESEEPRSYLKRLKNIILDSGCLNRYSAQEYKELTFLNPWLYDRFGVEMRHCVDAGTLETRLQTMKELVAGGYSASDAAKEIARREDLDYPGSTVTIIRHYHRHRDDQKK